MVVAVAASSGGPSPPPVFAFSGPRDDEFAGKKFSFVRYTSICAVIPDSDDFEAAARAAGETQAEFEKAAGAGGLTF